MTVNIDLNTFLSDHLLPVIFIVAGSLLLWQFSLNIISSVIKRTIRSGSAKNSKEEKQREDTLIGVFNAMLKISILVIGFMLLLAELGVEIAPLLAGAGIAGVALGFGAQFMVRDFLAGMFIIAENQYRVGDVVRFNNEDNVSGTVEQLSLRQTTLRNMDGMLHHIANGEIKIATNMTMEFAKVNLDIGVSYDTDLDKLEELINQVGLKLMNDENWQEKIIEPPTFMRVNEFAESAMIIKIVGETKPMEQWAVTGELRKRLKIAFDKNQINIPFPQRVIHESKKKISAPR